MCVPWQSLCTSVAAAANVQVPVAFLQVLHLLFGPEHELSQQVWSTQKFDPHSVSFAQVAPFGFLPVVPSRWLVQKLGAAHTPAGEGSVPPGRIPVHFPLPEVEQV